MKALLAITALLLTSCFHQQGETVLSTEGWRGFVVLGPLVGDYYLVRDRDREVHLTQIVK